MIPVPELLAGSPLFRGIAAGHIAALLECLSAARTEAAKGEFVFRAGDQAGPVWIVLSGGVHIVQEDFWGNRAILAYAGPAELFGEAFSCAETGSLPVSAVAAGRTELLRIGYRRIITACPASCGFHTGLIGNMLRIIAEKNIQLTRKMEILSRRTTREKLLAYLSAQALSQGADTFAIPFNRQELADYLCVDRSALSRELSGMTEEKLLSYRKNRFTLLITDT